MPSNHLILCCPLLLPLIFSSIRVFSSELALCIRWPKYWSFSVSPSDESSGLISFRTDWFDLLVGMRWGRRQSPHGWSRASCSRPSGWLLWSQEGVCVCVSPVLGQPCRSSWEGNCIRVEGWVVAWAWIRSCPASLVPVESLPCFLLAEGPNVFGT